MFFTALLLISTATTVALFVAAVKLEPIEAARWDAIKAKDKFAREYDFDNRSTSCGIGGLIAVVVTLGIGLACTIGTGANYGDNLAARKMALLLPQKERQREALIVAVKTQLSNDEYAQLTGIVDANAFIVFAKGTAVGDFLLARSAQIVGLNAAIYELHNELASKRIDLCNRLDNPFVPRLPFIGPGCAIDTHTPS